VKRAAEL